MEVTSVLEESLRENDIFNRNSFDKLLKLGFKDDEVLTLLASHKSLIKYGYRLSLDTLRHILSLSQEQSTSSPVKSLIKSPFLLAKTGWIYEHAPSFVFYNKYRQEELDSHIVKFAESYQSLFFGQSGTLGSSEKIDQPQACSGAFLLGKRDLGSC